MTQQHPQPLRRGRPAGYDRGESGFIIVAVLWILMALAALASAYALYTGNSAVAARVSNDRLQADALISAGLELTALRLLGKSAEDPRSAGEFQFQMGRADVAARFRSEGARIDLNAAPKDLLAGLFATLGAKPDDAAYYADRVIGWRKKAEGTPQNKEVELYKDAGLKYRPRQSPFENVAELRFVLGIPATLVERAMPFVTLFNGSPQVDVIVAPPEVVAALPHIESGNVRAVLDRRGGQDPKSILPMLGAARTSVSLEPRKATRVNIAITFKGGRHVEAEAVIFLVDKDTEPYRILAWRDDFDGAF
jgi:general secretion pathway protein K